MSDPLEYEHGGVHGRLSAGGWCQGVPGVEFLVTTVRADRYHTQTYVPTLSLLAELLASITPPTLLLRCARGENREAIWAMIAPADRDAALH